MSLLKELSLPVVSVEMVFTIYRRHWLAIGTKYLEDVPIQLQKVLDELGQRLLDGFPIHY